MIELDEIITLPSGTELSIEAALGDLARTRELLTDLHQTCCDEEANALAADIGHVEELLRVLAK